MDAGDDALEDRELLICRGTGDNLLLKNNGDGTFSDATEGSGVQGLWVATAAAADYKSIALVECPKGSHETGPTPAQ